MNLTLTNMSTLHIEGDQGAGYYDALPANGTKSGNSPVGAYCDGILWQRAFPFRILLCPKYCWILLFWLRGGAAKVHLDRLKRSSIASCMDTLTIIRTRPQTQTQAPNYPEVLRTIHVTPLEQRWLQYGIMFTKEVFMGRVDSTTLESLPMWRAFRDEFTCFGMRTNKPGLTVSALANGISGILVFPRSLLRYEI